MNRFAPLLFSFLFIASISVFAQDLNDPHEWKQQHRQQLEHLFKSARDEKPRAFDALYYRLNLTISYNPNNLAGVVTGRYRMTGALDTLLLDFDNGLTVSTVEGPVAGYRHENDYLRVGLDRTYLADESIEVTVRYSGVPDKDALGLFFDSMPPDATPHVWTLSEPYGARNWWPCKDSPADKADSVDIIVTVPQEQLVGSNGLLLSDVNNGDGTRTFHWHNSYPIAPYLVSLAVGEYVFFTDNYTQPDGSDLPLLYYVYPNSESEARRIFPEVKDHFDAMIHFFGPYPYAAEKYGMAEFNWGGAMEHQTLSSIGLVAERWRYVYVHELAHHWFGDALTCASWLDIWLNEGFASYAEALYAEWAGYNGQPPGMQSYHDYMETQRYLNGGAIRGRDTTRVSSIFNRIVYDKGSWVLHMLRGVLGDDDFFKAIYDYANDPALIHGAVNTNDFIRVCEDVSGKQLDAFFEQWLDYPFFPSYVVSWSEDPEAPFEPGKTAITLTIEQEQDQPVYQMPLRVTAVFENGDDSTWIVQNNQREQSWQVYLSDPPLDIILDRDNWVLKSVRYEQAVPVSPRLRIDNIYPNPFNAGTTIRISSWRPGDVQAVIYDLNGRQVRRLSPYLSVADREFLIRWDGLTEAGTIAPAGIYFVRGLRNGSPEGGVKKVILVK